MKKLNKADLPLQLQPYYQKLLEAKTEEETLSAVLELIEQEKYLSPEEKKKLDEMRMNTPMGRHKRRSFI